MSKKDSKLKNCLLRDDFLSAMINSPDFIVFDLETTGRSPRNSKITEICAIKYELKDNKFIEKEKYVQYINPECCIPENIEILTGITNDFVATMPTESECFKDIKRFFESSNCICGYNSNSFDIKFMQNLFIRQGEIFSPYEYELDAYILAKEIVDKDEVENYKLGTIAELYGVDDEIKHDATNDVGMTARLLNAFYIECLEDSLSVPPLMKCSINTLKYFKVYRTERIYVNTDKGTVYYDHTTKKWCGKDIGVNEVDMTSLVKDARNIAFANNDEDLFKNMKDLGEINA